MSKLSGQGLMAQAIYGLTNNFAVLSAGTSGGLTLEQIVNPSDQVNKNNINASFQSYLTQNFSNIDSDGDGKISATDLQQYTNQLSQKGLSYDELMQLCYSGNASSTLEEVLNNFQEIDKDGDGRVTNQEIAAYGMEEEMEEMEENYPKFQATNISNYVDNSDYDSSSV